MKTEKPTPHKLLKEARKGKSFNSRDLTTAAVLLAAIPALASLTSLQRVVAMYREVIGRGFQVSPAEVASMAMWAFLAAAGPVLLLAALAAVLASLLQSRGILATEMVRMDLSKLNPVTGVRNLFSLKVVKDLVRALAYTLGLGLWAFIAWKLFAPAVFGQVHLDAVSWGGLWREIGWRLLGGALLVAAPIYLLTGLVDWRLHVRDLRMDKSEVKQERKDHEGNAEIKQRRREIGSELSAQVQADVAGSSVILANPTHIAVGIYLHSDALPMPLVSVREKGARARKVIALAEKLGIPVVRDIRLARSVYARNRRYRFVESRELDNVVRLLRWLRDVEHAGADVPDVPDGTDAAAPPQ